MIRLVPAIALALALAGCSSDDDSGGGGPIGGDTVPPTTNPPADGSLSATLLGSWRSVEEGTQCVKTFAFDADGTYDYTSLDAVESGNHSLVQQGPDTVLMLEVTADNGLADCSGFSVDATGAMLGNAVNFPDQDTMVLGFDEDEPVVYTRQ